MNMDDIRYRVDHTNDYLISQLELKMISFIFPNKVIVHLQHLYFK